MRFAASAPRRCSASLSSLSIGPMAGALAAALLACGGGGGGAPPSPGIAVSSTSLVTSESGTIATFQVVLAAPPASSVTVGVTSTDSTEGLVRVQGDTYASSWEQLQFTPSDWNVARTIEIVPQDDAMADGNVAYSVTVGVDFTMDTGYAVVPDRSVSVTNSDDDAAGITVSKTALATSEAGPTTDSFTVTLNSQPTVTVVVPVTSSDPSEGLVRGGSSPGSPATTIQLTFTASSWNVPQTVTVVGQDDLVADGNQTFPVTVGAATGAPEYAALGPQSASMTNADDDTAGVTVLPSATPIVTSENGTTGTFSVRLNSEPVSDVVLPVASGSAAEGLLSGDGQGPAASISLVFTATDWNVDRAVTVTGQDDTAAPVPGDNAAYEVTVGPATGADPVYPGLAAIPVAVLNTDNDVATFSIPQAGGAPLQTSESGTTATFSIQINKQPAADVVIPVTVNDVTEGLVRAGAGIAAQSVSVTFTPLDWQTPQTITVVGQPDVMVDGNQTYTITVGPPSGDAEYVALGPQTISVTNADVNTAGYTVSRTAASHTEGGTPATFTVRLNTQPFAPVTIPVSSGNPAEGLVSGGDSGGAFVPSLDLTFDGANWSTPQTVSARGVVDQVVDGTQTYAIAVGPTSSADAPYQGLAAKTVTVTSYDADVAGYTVTPLSGLATSEAGGTATFSVVLDTIPTGTVNVPVNVSAPGEVLVSADGGTPSASLSLAFTSSDWDTPHVVTVHGVNDPVLDGAKDFTVTVGPTNSGDTHYASLPARTITGTNADDEAGVSEGSTGTGAKLVTVPYAGTVGTTYSYYRIAGLAAGSWAVSLSNVTADVALDVYSNANFSSGALLCSSNNAGRNAGEACIATLAAAGDLFVRVSGTATTFGAGFVLDVRVSHLYASADVPKTIPSTSASTVTSALTVSGAPASIAKVIVRLDITHTWDSDLTISLVHVATGTEVVLVQNRGGSSDNFTGTMFDDAAAVPISSGTAPFTGTFRPEQPLAGFNGLDANGAWTLKVVDSYSGDGGSLGAWSIEVF